MSVQSQLSKSSKMTQQIFDDITEQNQLKLIQKQGVLEQDILDKAWGAFGLYLSKQLRIGRAVSIPKLGLFTFSAPEVTLAGTTNPQEREPEKREPIFKVSPDIAKGMELKSAVIRESGLRPLVISSTAGKIQTTLISYSDISTQANLDKEQIKLAIDRIIKKFDERIRNRQKLVLLEIPAVGTIIVRKGLVAIAFNEFLKRDTVGLLKTGILDRKKKVENSLTRDKIQALMKQNSDNGNFDSILEVDENAKSWLEENLDIKFSVPSKSAKMSSQKNGGDIQNLFKTSEKQVSLNPLLEPSLKSQMGYEGISTQKETAKSSAFSLENQSLKKVRTKLQINEISPEESYLNLCIGIYGINANQKSVLHQEQLGLALQKQLCDLFDYELEALFKAIDFKKDQVIDLTEWTQIVCQQKTPQQFLLEEIKKYQYDAQKILKKIELTKDSHPQSTKQLIECIKLLNPELSSADIKRIVQYIMRGKNKITVEELLQYFQQEKLIDRQILDKNELQQKWYQEMLKQIKVIQDQHENSNHMMEIFQSFDDKMEGRLDIANFKTCLMQLKLGFSNDDFHRFVKLIEADDRQMVDYIKFVDSIKNSHLSQDQKGGLEYIAKKIQQVIKQKRFDFRDFFIFLTDNQELRKFYHIENRHMIKTDIFVELLAKQIFPKNKQSDVIQYGHIMDVDQDGFIDQYDLETFLGRYSYFQTIYIGSNNESSADYNKDTIIENGQQNLNETKPSLRYEKQNSKQNMNTAKSISLVRSHSNTQQDFFRKSSNSQSVKNSSLMLPKTQNTVYSFNQTMNSKGISRLFPTQTLSDQKLQIIIKEFKRVVIHNKQSWIEVFKIMDKNNNGFVTAAEFEDGIDKIIKLSKQAKEGLFAYFDNLKIGMFDLHRFISVMSRIDQQLYPTKFEDNWNWQSEIIGKWRQWYRSKNISIEEAFRLADFDFDGYLSQEDITKFLQKFLQIKEQELNNINLQRLVRLCDRRKRGVIQIADLEDILTSQKELALSDTNSISQGGATDRSSVPSNLKFTGTISRKSTLPDMDKQNIRSLSEINSHHKQWLESAKLQISMYILKNFENIQHSFEVISKHSSQLEYNSFKKWLETFDVLKGFNLTDNLLKTLYSFADQHKKGFLSLTDWERAFGQIGEQKYLVLEDIQKSVYSNFATIGDAFQFFQNPKTKTVGFQEFKMAVKSQFQKIYDIKNISQAWQLICDQLLRERSYDIQLTYKDFNQIFKASKFKQMKNQGTSLKNSTNSLGGSFGASNSDIYGKYVHFNTTEDIYTKFSSMLIASGKNIQVAFQEIDKQNTGYVSTMEFKHVLMKLNLGLNSKEIDTLVLLNGVTSKQIKWRQFCQKLKLDMSDQQIVNRSQERIISLRKELYDYMISPKDAYRTQDVEKKQKMSFAEFRQLLINISLLSGKEVQPYAVAKDMFDFIDIKGDNFIDIEEWVQTFSRYDNSRPIDKSRQMKVPQRTQSLKDLQNSQIKLIESRFDKPMFKQKLEDEYITFSYGDHFKSIDGLPLKWERTKQYDQVIRLIGKNRRILAIDFVEAGAIGENMMLHRVKVYDILNRWMQHYGINIAPQNWEVIFHFAQEKDQMINCKFLLEIFKKRLMDYDSQPHNQKKIQ